MGFGCGFPVIVELEVDDEGGVETVFGQKQLEKFFVDPTVNDRQKIFFAIDEHAIAGDDDKLNKQTYVFSSIIPY
ncbi:494_t:CDS:2 [Entrophospora sp. SA101]|nr:494_t:CDS:2 [Entrophospora sp. SA101]